MTKDQVKEVEDALMAKNYTQAKSIIIKYSAEAMRNMGVNPASQYAERLRSIETSTLEAAHLPAVSSRFASISLRSWASTAAEAGGDARSS